MDQKILSPFLRSNPKNQIDLYSGSLYCSDCRNFWLQRKPDLLKQVNNSKCSSGKDLNDTANFINCGIKHLTSLLRKYDLVNLILVFNDRNVSNDI